MIESIDGIAVRKGTDTIGTDKETGADQTDLVAAAGAIKSDLRDVVPAATTSEQTGTVRYTITLTMDDDSTIVYILEVNYTIAATAP